MRQTEQRFEVQKRALRGEIIPNEGKVIHSYKLLIHRSGLAWYEYPLFVEMLLDGDDVTAQLVILFDAHGDFLTTI